MSPGEAGPLPRQYLHNLAQGVVDDERDLAAEAELIRVSDRLRRIVATAASMALPPSLSTDKPASTASAPPATTAPRAPVACHCPTSRPAGCRPRLLRGRCLGPGRYGADQR